jgi:outer membrane protein assembly factor BamB
VGGELFALNPATGAVLHGFDPAMMANPAIGGLTAPTIGADGLVYVGVRGKHPTAAQAAVNGRMLALSYSIDSGFSLVWDYAVEGQLDWVPPAIGANGALYFGSSAPFMPGLEILWFAPTEPPPTRSPMFYGVFE